MPSDLVIKLKAQSNVSEEIAKDIKAIEELEEHIDDLENRLIHYKQGKKGILNASDLVPKSLYPELRRLQEAYLEIQRTSMKSSEIKEAQIKLENEYNNVIARLQTRIKIHNKLLNEQTKTLKYKYDAEQKDIHAIKQLNEEEKKSNAIRNANITTLVRYIRQISTLGTAFYTMKKAYDAIIGEGVRLNKQIQDQTLGISALITANTRLVNGSDDLALRFKLAKKEASDLIQYIRKMAIDTPATFQELTALTQQALGPALGSGKAMGKNLEEQLKNTVGFATKMSNFAASIGMEMFKVNEEIRSIMTGNISQDSIIAKMLGITNEDVKNAKKTTDGLIDYLNEKFSSMDILASEMTLNKALARLKDTYQSILMDSTSGINVFLQNSVLDLQKYLELNKKDIQQAFKDMVTIIIDSIKAVTPYIVKFIAFLRENSEVVKGLIYAYLSLKTIDILRSTIKTLISTFKGLKFTVGVAGSTLKDFGVTATSVLATIKKLTSGIQALMVSVSKYTKNTAVALKGVGASALTIFTPTSMGDSSLRPSDKKELEAYNKLNDIGFVLNNITKDINSVDELYQRLSIVRVEIEKIQKLNIEHPATKEYLNGIIDLYKKMYGVYKDSATAQKIHNQELIKEAKAQLEVKQALEEKYPILADTSKLLKDIKIPKIETSDLDVLKAKLQEINVLIKSFEQKESISLEDTKGLDALLNRRLLLEDTIAKFNEAEKQNKAKEYANALKEINKEIKELQNADLSDFEKEQVKIWEQYKEFSNKIGKSKADEWLNLAVNNSVSKQLKEDAKVAEQAWLEYYETMGLKQEAWAIKEKEIREKYLSAGLSDEQVKELIKAKEKEYKKIEQHAKKQMSEVEKNYNKMIANMQKTIESSFFDVINGKIKTLKDLFKDLGKTILQDFLSPYISALSGFLSKAGAGVLGGLLPSFSFGNSSGASKVSLVADFAKEKGLSLGESGNYEGVINGTKVAISKNGDVISGGDVLGDVSNILSGASAIKNLVSGEWLEKVQNIGNSITNGFSGFFDSIGNWINNIGTFGSKLLYNSFSGIGSWLGNGFLGDALSGFGFGAKLAGINGITGIGSAFNSGLSTGFGFLAGNIANAGMGGFLGYGIGSIGDWLFKADTHAGTGGAIGGALGSIIMPGIGTIVGGLLGSVIGGIFGKKKVTGSGLYLGDNIDFGEYFSTLNLKGYIDYKKKGWFSSKSWTEYQNLSDKKIKEINRVLENQYATLVKLGANLDKFELAVGKYANNSLFDTALPTALLKSFLNINDKSEIDAQIKAIQEKAKENNISYAQQISNQFGTFMQMQTSILNQIYKNDPVKQAKLAYDDTMYALKTAMRNAAGGFNLFGLNEESFKDLAQLSAETLNKAFNESLRQDFSPENLEIWQQLTQAYTQAQEQVKNLLNSIIQKTQELMNLHKNFLAVNGINSNAFDMASILNQYATLMHGLKNDLSTKEKEILNDVFKANDKILEQGSEWLKNFTQSGDSELRKQLISVITSLKQTIQAQGGLVFSTNALDKIAEIDKQIAALKDPNSQEYAQLQIKNNNEMIELLKSQLSVLNSLSQSASKIRDMALTTNNLSNSLYYEYLEQAKEAFKNKDLTSEIYSKLQNEALNQANNLKNLATSRQEYQLALLKMASELESIGGDITQVSLEEEIKKLQEENNKWQEKILNTNASSLEELEKLRKQLVEQAQEEAKKMTEYLGKNSVIAQYLNNVVAEVAKGTSTTQAGLNNLYLALKYYQGESSNVSNDYNQSINNPYKKMKAFADGGIVTHPTNALIGENGYPEAVIPLKDGKGLKVDMQGAFISLVNEMKEVKNILFKSQEYHAKTTQANENLVLYKRQEMAVLDDYR